MGMVRIRRPRRAPNLNRLLRRFGKIANLICQDVILHASVMKSLCCVRDRFAANPFHGRLRNVEEPGWHSWREFLEASADRNGLIPGKTRRGVRKARPCCGSGYRNAFMDTALGSRAYSWWERTGCGRGSVQN